MSNFKINNKTQVITFTKSFMDNVNKMLNPEAVEQYKTITSLYPNYRHRTVKSHKKTYEGLTIAVMELYIERNNTAILADFQTLLAYYENDTASYPKIKSWFLGKNRKITQADIDALIPLTADKVRKAKEKAKANADAKANKLADDIIKMIKAGIDPETADKLSKVIGINQPIQQPADYDEDIQDDENEMDEMADGTNG